MVGCGFFLIAVRGVNRSLVGQGGNRPARMRYFCCRAAGGGRTLPASHDSDIPSGGRLGDQSPPCGGHGWSGAVSTGVWG